MPSPLAPPGRVLAGSCWKRRKDVRRGGRILLGEAGHSETGFRSRPLGHQLNGTQQMSSRVTRRAVPSWHLSEEGTLGKLEGLWEGRP